MNTTDLIGSAAAICTTLAFVPQAWLIWKTKHAEGVSLGMYSIFITGVTLWLVYGCLLGAMPLIAANAVTLILALSIFVMKIRYR